MRPLLRFFVWLRDSLPLYSRRDCARAWMQGRDSREAEIGLKRDGNGRFVGVRSGNLNRRAS